MKYLIFASILIYYVIRDMAMLLKSIDLVRGLAYLFLTAFLGIFFCAWLDIAKQHARLRRKLGPQVFDWLEGNDE